MANMLHSNHKKERKKQTLSQPQKFPKDKTFTSSANKTKAEKYRETTKTAEMKQKENESRSDCEVAATAQQLENVI